MGNVHTVGPDKVIVVSGGCCGGRHQKRWRIGGWIWRWWCVSSKAYIDLNVMTLLPHCEDVESKEGVQLTVNGVAQVRVMTPIGHFEGKVDSANPVLMDAALEQFLGRTEEEVKHSIQETLEGHLRAIIGQMTVEEVYRDREKFSNHVRELASTDLGRMGMEIVSFTIKDIHDSTLYLDSLGKAQIANVKRDAAVGVANAEKEAGIQESICQKEAEAVSFAVNAKVAQFRRNYETKQFEFTEQIQTKNAEAELAYKLETMKLEQSIKKEEIEINVVERKKNIEIEEKEVLRKDKELTTQVRLPAAADTYKVKTEAEGKQRKTIEIATANAEKTKLIGDAKAVAIELKGKARARGMKLKASSYLRYGEEAVVSMVLDKLPTIARSVSSPLKKTDEIVMLAGNDSCIGREVSRITAALPPSVRALTGIDLNKTLRKASENLTAEQPA